MMSGKYFMKFGGRQFEDHVLEKFNGLFPDMKENAHLKLALMHIKFRTILPVFKDDGYADRRYKRGISNINAARCTPASIQSPLSPSKIDDLCKKTKKLQLSEPCYQLRKRIKKPEQEGPEKLGMKQKYSKTMVKDYHTCQRELLEGLLNIRLDNDGFMKVDGSSTTTPPTANEKGGRKRRATTSTSKATTEEFVQKLDSESKSVMEDYAAVQQTTTHPDPESDELEKKTTLCFEIVIGRLLIQLNSMESSNDFMTEKGWKAWREHALVVASFAVYFLALQLYRYKKYGSFLNMTE